MPDIPQKIVINQNDILGSREIRFTDRNDASYPQLLRLHIDFDFSILQLQRKIFSHLTQKMVPNTPEYVLATRGLHDHLWYSLTPGFTSLAELDVYTKRHEIDILHDYLFSGDGKDTTGFYDNSY